jgi:hypothetical protein
LPVKREMPLLSSLGLLYRVGYLMNFLICRECVVSRTADAQTLRQHKAEHHKFAYHS